MHTDTFSQLAIGTRLPRSALSFWRRLFALPSYHWLLFACLLTLGTHLVHIPLWLGVLGGISVIAQFPSIKAKFNKQKSLYKGVQYLTFLSGLAGIWLTFRQILMTDVSICFLVLCLFSKLWELYNKRDAYVVLNLCLFIVASAFLWSQSPGMTVLAVLAVAGVLFAFIALADDHNRTGQGRLRALAWVMLPAVPLLVVLFLFFPRFDPLWTLNLAGNQAKTGISDSMSPGDFANLSKSTELAFRVEFDGKIPHRNDLYWRGLVFEHFDGTTWREAYRPRDHWRSLDDNTPDWATQTLTGNSQNYTVLLEPTQQNWLFGLDYSRLSPARGLATVDDFTLRSFRPVTQKLNYQANYFFEGQAGLTLSDIEHKAALQLPKEGNPKARAFAQSLASQAGGDTTALINLFKNHIQHSEFYYTLSPPALNSERIDEFLFGTRQGFCEHYASSFVFVLRAAGVPSRVVTGYQGGQLGRDGASWEVRQMDAHAWAEVWVDGQGWVRADPTAFVAPNRILDGMSDYTEQQGAEAFGDGVAGTIGYQQFRLLQSLYRLSDELDYQWQKRIVGFDADNQKNSLKNLGIGSLTEQLFVLVGVFCSLVAVMGVVFWYRRRVIYHVFDKPIYQLSKRLAKQNANLAKAPSESYLGYLTRLQTQTDDPHTLEQLARLAKEYRAYRFGQLSENPNASEYKQTAKAFGRAIRAIK